MFACLAIVALAAALPLGARGADIPTTPFLRIETGMHGAAINGIAADATDRQLVTVSDDKTARIWSAGDGDLVATLRVPIGPGAEGGLYAVALSPSGKTIAVGGYSGISWDGGAEIISSTAPRGAGSAGSRSGREPTRSRISPSRPMASISRSRPTTGTVCA